MPRAEDLPRWLVMLQRVANGIGVLLFVALVLVMAVQIGARWVLQTPLAWTDELAVVLYIAAMLWAAGCVCREREHVAFAGVYERASPRVQRVMALLAQGGLAGLLLWALPAVWDYIVFMQRESTPVLGLPMHYVFAPFVVWMAMVVLRALWRVWGLLGRHWESYL